MVNTKIHKTNEYGKFKLIRTNRPVNHNHVTTLKNKIAINDKSPVNPIIVNSKFQIVDGQHRFSALKKLKKDIYYVIDNDYNELDLIEFNLNQRNWTHDDFLSFYIKKGNKNYKIFDDFQKQYDLRYVHAAKLLVATGRNNASKIFKSGKMDELRDMKRAHGIAKILSELEESFRAINLALLGAICYLYDNHSSDIDFVVLIEKLNERSFRSDNKLIPKGSVREQIRFLDDVYNARGGQTPKHAFSAMYELGKS